MKFLNRYKVVFNIFILFLLICSVIPLTNEVARENKVIISSFDSQENNISPTKVLDKKIFPQIQNNYPLPDSQLETQISQDFIQKTGALIKEKDLELNNLYQQYVDDALSNSLFSDLEYNYKVVDQTEESLTKQFELDDGSFLTEKINFPSVPNVEILTPNITEEDDIHIPILKSGSGWWDIPVEYRTSTRYTTIGATIPISVLNEEISQGIGIGEVDLSVKFTIYICLRFPIKLSIIYPSAVFNGQSYKFSVEIEPYDATGYEFYVQSHFDIDIDIYLAGVSELLSLIGQDCLSYSKSIISPKLFSANWITPMGDSPSIIRLDQYEVADLFGLVEAGIGGYAGLISADKLKGTLNVISNDLLVKKDCVWGENHNSLFQQLFETFDERTRTSGWAGNFNDNFKDEGTEDIIHNIEESIPEYEPETRTLDFTIPWDTTDKEIILEVNKLEYFPGKIFIEPTVYVYFKGDLSSLGDYNFPIPLSDKIEAAMIMAELFSTGASGYYSFKSPWHFHTSISFLTGKDYNFVMEIAADRRIYSRTRYYYICLYSKGTQKDLIKLSVDGLPAEFEVSFEDNPAEYIIKPVSYSVEVNYDPIEIEVKQHKHFIETYLRIDIPETFTTPPGDLNFNIKAVSSAKEHFKFSNPSIIQNCIYKVPECPQYSLNVDAPSVMSLNVYPNDAVTIPFSVSNIGNIDDDINIKAVLYKFGNKEHKVKEWNFDYSLDVSRSYSNSISFNFDASNIYLPPGPHKLKFIASSTEDPSNTQEFSTTLLFKEYYDFRTTMAPAESRIFGDYHKEFTLEITNLGNIVDDYSLTSSGWDGYVTYPSVINNLNPGQTEETLINLDIPFPEVVTPDNYTFRITATSKGSGLATHYTYSIFDTEDVFIEYPIQDFDAPRLDHYYREEILIYPQSSLNLGSTWTVYDENPEDYVVYIDEIEYESGPWINGSTFDIYLTGINPETVGLYNVTVVFSDIYYQTLDTVWIQIIEEDIVDPAIIAPMNLSLPENFVKERSFSWFINETNLLNIGLLVNSSLISMSELYLHSEAGKYELRYYLHSGDLEEGLWNFTVFVQDLSDNWNVKTFYVTIEEPDISDPIILIPPVSLSHQGHSENMMFRASDAFSTYYELWINGQLFNTSEWISDENISYTLDDLPLLLGNNDLELTFFDMSNNSLNYGWVLISEDIDSPLITSGPDDYIAYEHNLTSFGLPMWQIDESNPHNYSMYVNGEKVVASEWINMSNGVFFSPYSLKKGTYEITASFQDLSGNSASDSFTLTVLDINAPYIHPIDHIFFEPYLMANWFEFFIEDDHPMDFEIYLDNSIIKSGKITEFYKVALIELELLASGTYNYTIVVTDESGNRGTRSVNVTILDYSPPSIIGPPFIIFSEDSEIDLNWTILEPNSKSYSLYLNGELQDHGDFGYENSTNKYAITLNDLSIGSYEVVFTVEDFSNQSTSFLSYIEVIDNNAPSIQRMGDFSVSEGDSKNNLQWIVHEKHPESYTIWIDGELAYSENNWNGSSIELRLANWKVGTYIVKLFVQDTSGNYALDEVEITVLESSAPLKASSGFDLLVIVTYLVLYVRGRKNKRLK